MKNRKKNITTVIKLSLKYSPMSESKVTHTHGKVFVTFYRIKWGN